MKVQIIANVALAGLSFFALAGNYAFSHEISPQVVIFAFFGVLFLATSYLIAKRRRVALAVSGVASLAVFAITMAVVPTFLTEPVVYPRFAFAVAMPPVAILVAVSSFLGWAELRAMLPGPGVPSRRRQTSTLLAFVVLGFIAGGLVIGAIAANTESTLLANSNVSADVTIVLGAGNQGNPLPYSPSPYTIKVGATVTWVNKDATTHTVTSSGVTLFDSGNLAPGATYSFTFTQPGTYQYYCTIHPWMKGTIVVTSG